MTNEEYKGKVMELKARLVSKIGESLDNLDKISGEEAMAYAQAGNILTQNMDSYMDSYMNILTKYLQDKEEKDGDTHKEGDNWDSGFFGQSF